MKKQALLCNGKAVAVGLFLTILLAFTARDRRSASERRAHQQRAPQHEFRQPDEPGRRQREHNVDSVQSLIASCRNPSGDLDIPATR